LQRENDFLKRHADFVPLHTFGFTAVSLRIQKKPIPATLLSLQGRDVCSRGSTLLDPDGVRLSLYSGFYWVHCRTFPPAVWERLSPVFRRASTLSGSLCALWARLLFPASP
jgi:hypothetical protein